MKKLLLISSIFIVNELCSSIQGLKEGIISSDYQQVAQNITTPLSSHEKVALKALADDVLHKKELEFYYYKSAGFKMYDTPRVRFPEIAAFISGILFWLSCIKPNKPDASQSDLPAQVLTGMAFFASLGATWYAVYCITCEYYYSEQAVEDAQRIKYLVTTSL